MPVLQERSKKIFIEVDDVAIYISFKMPAVNLAGYHEIDLEGSYREFFKIDRMCSITFRKKDKVMKGMPVWMVQMPIVFVEISPKTFDQKICGVMINLMNIVNGDCLIHVV